MLTFLYTLEVESFTAYMKKTSAPQAALYLFCCFFPSGLCGHLGDAWGIDVRDIAHSHLLYRISVLSTYLPFLHIVDILHVFVYMLFTYFLHCTLGRLHIVCMLSTTCLEIVYVNLYILFTSCLHIIPAICFVLHVCIYV